MSNPLIKIENKVKVLHNSRLISPQVHWKFLVKFFLILALFLIIFSLYFQYKISNKQIFQVIAIPTNPPSFVNKVLLKKVNQSFQNKEIQETYIKKNNLLFSDPS